MIDPARIRFISKKATNSKMFDSRPLQQESVMLDNGDDCKIDSVATTASAREAFIQYMARLCS